MLEQFKQLFLRLPLVPLLVAYGGYLGWDYYQFETDAQSPLIQKQQSVKDMDADTAKVQVEIKKAKDFYQTLNARKDQLRALALQLEEMKTTLSDQLDISSFIKTVVNEAKRVGVSVQGIKPTDVKESEFYTEQPFEMIFHGVYVQLVVLLDRLSKLERIIRVDQFSMKAVSLPSAQYVELEGTLQLKSYRYKGTKADDVGKPPVNAGATPAPSGQLTPSAAAPTKVPTVGETIRALGDAIKSPTNPKPVPSATASATAVNGGRP